MSISVLPSNTINLLKSSQVITSLGSVVKELVENSLDAQATVISVKLENYGFDRIEVKDNGCGIIEDDVQFVAKPHFTSKINCFEDLGNLSSYGFRGEALASLCTVSDVTINTKCKELSFGFTYKLNNSGNIKDKKPAAITTGTSILVQNLFKNLPVRRHFYSNSRRKKDELRKIEHIIMAFAVIKPALHLSLLHDKHIIFQKPSSTEIKFGLHSVFQETAKKLIYKHCELENLRLEVWLPEKVDFSCSASSPDKLFICANERPISCKAIEKLVKAYYSQKLEGAHGKYPVGVISIHVPPSHIDVNLEPNKTRVFFQDEKEILEAVQKLLVEIYGVIFAATGTPKTISECDDALPCTLAHSCPQSQISDSQSDLEDTSRILSNRKSIHGTNSQSEVLSKSKTSKGLKNSLSRNRQLPNNFDNDFREAGSNIENTEEENVEFNFNTNLNTHSNSLRDNTTGKDDDCLVNVHENERLLVDDERTAVNADKDGLDSKERVHDRGKDEGIGATLNERVIMVDDICFAITMEDENSAKMNETMNENGEKQTERMGDSTVKENEGMNCIERGTEKINENQEKDAERIIVNDKENERTNNAEKETERINESSVINNKATNESSLNTETTGTNTDKNCEPTPKTSTIRNEPPNSPLRHISLNEDRINLTKDSPQRVDKRPQLPEDETARRRERENDGADVGFGRSWSEGRLFAEKENIQSVQLFVPPVALHQETTWLADPPRLPAPSSKRKATEGTSFKERGTACNFKKLRKDRVYTLPNSPLPSVAKKPDSAFALFAKAMRKKVIEENPGSDFTVIAQELATRWKNADAETKLMYEAKAANPARLNSSRDACFSPSSDRVPTPRRTSPHSSMISVKPTRLKVEPIPAKRPWQNKSLKIEFSLQKLKEKVKRNTRAKMTSTALVGNLKGVNGWIYRHGNSICALNSSRLNEVLLFRTLIGSFSVPTIKLEAPVPLNAENLGIENWSTLLSLKRRVTDEMNEHVVTDPRIASNGFKVLFFADSDSSVFNGGEIAGIADSLPQYGIEDLKEVLVKLRCQPDLSLEKSRPSNLQEWFKAQALRMARGSPHIRDFNVLEEKLNKWSKSDFQRGSLDVVCGHGNPIFNVISVLEES